MVIQESGSRTKKKEKAPISTQMAKGTRATGWKIKSMAMDSTDIKMEMFIKENGDRIIAME